MSRYPTFIGNSDRSESIVADCEVTMNWYYEKLPGGAKSDGALYPTPGFEQWIQVPSVGARAGLTTNGRTFVVIGPVLYELFATPTRTALYRATLAQDTNPATISSNGDAGGQLFITSGTFGYCYDLTTNVVTPVLTGTATMGGMLDGYFLAFDLITSTVRISDLNDGMTWDPTQFVQRSSAADNWQCMVVVQQPAGIWLIGSSTGEVWYDAGTFPFPFAPIDGASFRFGIAAPFAFGLGGNRMTWLSQNDDGAGLVVSSQGYSPQRISTSAVETAIAGYQRDGRINDAEMLTYQQQGHIFSVLTFPTANATWCYDQTMNLWHQRGHWNNEQMRFDYWRPRICFSAFGTQLVGERATGTLSRMEPTLAYEADSTPIRRVRRAPGLTRENYPIVYRRFELYLQNGVGVLTGQGSNPIVMVRTSDDGGRTWLPERQGSAGAIGAFKTQVYWTRLGASKDRVFEVSVSDPVPWRLIDAWLNNDNPSQGA